MPIYRKCTECGKKVLEGTLCKCEEKRRKERYKEYRMNRNDKKEQSFYSSTTWIRCRDSVAVHQFGLDLIEWSKGNIVQAETYHHIEPIKSDWSKRLDSSNLIGLTQENHIRVHTLMNKSDKDKIMIEKFLKDLIKKFNKEFY
ncbi:hypothetical protein [Clostridium botulinum]|uniref:HNH endonuclease n=1 Tax=Clostridium botulinum TaxID=1491 RepID=A0A846I2T8_CLOBO|nr:hypothetical protein [Clostridium botulinum]AJE10162.1 putative hNH endonuclease domain protein [Clostridium botulinum CDC_1436]AJE11278.1 putative hNH endonuclease domain protein [Clostridium botulinum CDC_1436]EDT84733.1 HNH endonuclease domain protein [Clostridium botulinum Bf]MBO0530396.1 hypothetical protein [Clostridium botulinum]MBO0538475.1 hypothetical protein [Clostridium botulinum]